MLERQCNHEIPFMTSRGSNSKVKIGSAIPPMNDFEMKLSMLALKTAIERVGAISLQANELRLLPSPNRLIASLELDPHNLIIGLRDAGVIIDQAQGVASDADRILPPLALPKRVPRSPAWKWNWSGPALLLRGGMVAVFTMALCVILDGQFGLFGLRTPPAVKAIALTTDKKGAPESKSVVQAPSVVQPQLPALPLPHAHGVYAIGNGEIHELEALPGRVPDQRVFMSWAISAPSRKILPDGKIVFVAFRRDLATNPPDRTTVRIIAKIIRAGTFDTAGVANAATVGDTWAIRGNSYGLRVAPLGENPEMLVMRPENSDFVFPAGRYGLMVKGRAYDFTVAGPITAAAQCLERIEAARGTFYAECQNP